MEWLFSIAIVEPKQGALIFQSKPAARLAHVDGFPIALPDLSLSGNDSFNFVVYLHPVRGVSGEMGRIKVLERNVTYTSFVFDWSRAAPSSAGRDSRRKSSGMGAGAASAHSAIPLEIHFGGTMIFSPREGTRTGDFAITRVILDETHPTIAPYIGQTNRIVMSISVMERMEKMSVKTTYLGRAQKVEGFTATTNGRVYHWEAAASDDAAAAGSFPGIPLMKKDSWPKHLADYGDYLRVRKQATGSGASSSGLLSPRPLPPRDLPDHDDYSNPSRALPIVLTHRQTLVCKFFNLGIEDDDCAGRYIEVRFKGSDLYAASGRVQVTPDLECEAHRDDKDQIVSIRLIARNYIKSLLFPHPTQINTV